MSETEKTVQEVAKATGKVSDAATKLGSFLNKCLGAGLVNLGASFSDWTQKYRYENLLKLIDQIEIIHRQRNIEGKENPILPKHLIPILEYASLEDSKDVREMWAGLIANATDPNCNLRISKIYIDLLSSLEPIDSIILEHLSKQDELMEVLLKETKRYRNAYSIAAALNLDRDDCLISLSNLARLNLIEDGWGQTIESLDYGYSGFRVNSTQSHFSLSLLGKSLITACETE